MTKKTKPMTRDEIAKHAHTVATHYLAGDTASKDPHEIDSVELLKLTSMVELAMCRAAGIEWGRK